MNELREYETWARDGFAQIIQGTTLAQLAAEMHRLFQNEGILVVRMASLVKRGSRNNKWKPYKSVQMWHMQHAVEAMECSQNDVCYRGVFSE